MRHKARILVVDDESRLVQVLQRYLAAVGYSTEAAYTGKEALACVQAERPDLILLDVMMPEMDGFEVCRRLKGDPATAIIPIIMVTALSARKERLEGIAAGADDFLTKPIEPGDLTLRVRNAIRMKSLYDDLERSYAELGKLQALRDHLLHLLVHDMQTPLQGLLGYLELLDLKADEGQRKYLERARESGRLLVQLTEDLLSVHQIESGQLRLRRVPTTLGELWAEARPVLEPMAKIQQVDLRSLIPADGIPLQADRDLIRRVLINLVGNALKFTPPGGRVELDAARASAGGEPLSGGLEAAEPALDGSGQASWVVVSVQDTGPGIPEEYHGKIFEKFGVVEAQQAGARRSTGLGLAFCKLAVEAHGGRIGVESKLGQGSTFWFVLPGG